MISTLDLKSNTVDLVDRYEVNVLKRSVPGLYKHDA
jgi:hypothetical protein